MTEQKSLTLTPKEETLRNYILNSNMFPVTLRIGIPVALYQSLNQIFRIFDSLLASQIDAAAASMVTYFSQINFILQGLGLGLAAGACLKISQAYGEGNYELVKKRVSSLLAFTVLSIAIILAILLPLSTPFMTLTKTPAEFITIGRNYFLADLLGTLVTFFNSVYIAIERSKGNSKQILYVNSAAIAVKFALSLLSVYVLQKGVTYIALSTLAAQLLITVAAVIKLSRKNEVFSFSLKSVSLRGTILWPMLLISFPIMIEKSAFHLGKAAVNSMVSMYGSLTIGGLGISNLICGISTAPLNGFQETSASIISQNFGADNIRRALDSFKAILIITLAAGLLFFLPSYYFASEITAIFAPSDPAFHETLLSIYRYDIWSIFPLAINTSVMALLYGFGYTKLTLLINFCRVFLFRIPVLWGLQNFTGLGSESAGIIMIVSNLLVAVLSIIIGCMFIIRISRKYKVPFFQKK